MDVFETLAGRLLVAMPDMGDPRFARSVVFLCEHSDEGAMGLILNKPLEDVGLSDVAEQMDIEVDAPRAVPVLFGGPVERQRGFVLHEAPPGLSGDAPLGCGFALSVTRDILEALSRGEGPERCLLALGYSGWGAGQLEAELAENAWLVGTATPALVFGPAEAMWAGALRAIGVDPQMLSAGGGRA